MFLRQPVHALIFLFRFKTEDEQDQYTGTQQDHIWFANQIPDFACASIALLNIVNNIPDLETGKELRDFKNFTKDMDPITRGETIDDFDFVRRIHNSFARENDLLQADMHARSKIAKAKKRAAALKAAATKAANKVAKDSPPKAVTNGNRKGGRGTQPSRTPSSRGSNPATRRATRSTDATPEAEDEDFKPGARGRAKGKPKARAKVAEEQEDDQAEEAVGEQESKPRRSGRARKPRKTEVYESEAEEPQEGYHFIAYMPIGDHVWKLDGMDYHPHDLGSFGLGGNGADGGTGNWLDVAAPTILGRMLQFEGEDIEYNLMAVVHDTILDDRRELLGNVKTIQVVDKKLDTLFEDWRALDGAETKKDALTGASPDFDIMWADIDATELPASVKEVIDKSEDFMELIKYRQSIISKQTRMRDNVRAARNDQSADQEKARHRRHDYGSFVRRWMSALAEEGNLVIDD